MKEVKSKQQKDKIVYLTQKELATRWRVSQATVKAIREKGEIQYFFPPGSSRVLYPVNEIFLIEQDKTNFNHKEIKRGKELPKTRVK